jgi:hypothetical protein
MQIGSPQSTPAKHHPIVMTFVLFSLPAVVRRRPPFRSFWFIILKTSSRSHLTFRDDTFALPMNRRPGNIRLEKLDNRTE